jgi:hypothetical protein
VLIRPEKQLNRLPGYKPSLLKRRDSGRCEPVIGRMGLQRVQAPERLVYEGYCRWRSVHKEYVVVPTNGTVEGSKLGRGEVIVVIGMEVVRLETIV